MHVYMPSLVISTYSLYILVSHCSVPLSYIPRNCHDACQYQCCTHVACLCLCFLGYLPCLFDWDLVSFRHVCLPHSIVMFWTDFFPPKGGNENFHKQIQTYWSEVIFSSIRSIYQASIGIRAHIWFACHFCWFCLEVVGIGGFFLVIWSLVRSSLAGCDCGVPMIIL